MKPSCIKGLALIGLMAMLGGCSPQSNPNTTSTPQTSVSETTTSVTQTSASETTTSPLRIGSLKGPTSIGLVSLMNNQQRSSDYTFTMVTAADELLAQVAGGQLDIALIPANVAAVLYQKTDGDITVLNINTLGVLNLVSADSSIQSLSDLSGKTVYLTGKGTVPDYVLRYLLTASGLSEQEVTLEYKSEPAEVAALLKEQPAAIGLLPQPFATATTLQNEDLQILIDLNTVWKDVQQGNPMITGVTIVRNQVLTDSPEQVKLFMQDHKQSVDFATSKPEETADLVVKAGIIDKAALAQKALPYCNLACIEGKEMETALSDYLQTLYDQDPKSVGGSLPDSEFYYLPQ